MLDFNTYSAVKTVLSETFTEQFVGKALLYYDLPDKQENTAY